MENDENWAKAENPEVEEANVAFAEAQKTEILRQMITKYATGAVSCGGVDRDWANTQLIRLGAYPVTGNAQYKINVPITGDYGTAVTASNRAEALEKFAQYTAALANVGQFTGGHGGVYGIEFTGDPTFFSGPQDPEEYDGTVPGLDALKTGIRQMIKQGITEQGWGHSYAIGQLADMGLEPLPDLEFREVAVPVSGTAHVTVTAFAGDDDETVLQSASANLGRNKRVFITPEEVGVAWAVRPDTSETMGLKLLDDEEHLGEDLF